jgi:hypothetical protein
MKADQLQPRSKERVAAQVIVNNSVNQPPPRPPSAGALPRSTAGGRVLEGTQPAPLLVLARFEPTNQLTKNKTRRVTPFWHNDTPSRVTLTFGARRPLPDLSLDSHHSQVKRTWSDQGVAWNI